MSVVNLINSIDQSLLEPAIKSQESLNSLKRQPLVFIEKINKKLKVQYNNFDQIYLQTRENFPYFEKDQLQKSKIEYLPYVLIL